MGQPEKSRTAQDGELLRRLCDGDESAVADLAREYGPRIQQMALRYLRNAEDAEEITQDVLFKTVEKVADFRGDAALSSWLYRVTFNAAMSRLRQLRALRGAEASGAAADTPEDTPSEIPDWSAMADEAALRGQMRRRLALAVRSLPPIYPRTGHSAGCSRPVDRRSEQCSTSERRDTQVPAPSRAAAVAARALGLRRRAQPAPLVVASGRMTSSMSRPKTPAK